jgi:hypothetical protein
MGTVDFSNLKIKLIASIVAISAIALLRAYLPLADAGTRVDQTQLRWIGDAPDLRHLGRAARRDGLDRLARDAACARCFEPSALSRSSKDCRLPLAPVKETGPCARRSRFQLGSPERSGHGPDSYRSG